MCWAKSMRPDFSHNPLISDCWRAQLPVTAFHKSEWYFVTSRVLQKTVASLSQHKLSDLHREASPQVTWSLQTGRNRIFFYLTPIKRSYKNNELQQACTANLKGWLLTQTSMLSIYPIRTLSKLLESLNISVFLTVICALKKWFYFVRLKWLLKLKDIKKTSIKFSWQDAFFIHFQLYKQLISFSWCYRYNTHLCNKDNRSHCTSILVRLEIDQSATA